MEIKPHLNWLAAAFEKRLPLSESNPVWVRHGLVQTEGAPTILPHCHTNCEIGIWFEGEGHILGEAESCFHQAGDLFLAGPGTTTRPESHITRFATPRCISNHHCWLKWGRTLTACGRCDDSLPGKPSRSAWSGPRLDCEPNSTRYFAELYKSGSPSGSDASSASAPCC